MSMFINGVIIVGAGVAGSALAHTLGKDGHQVLLIEKNLKERKTIAGEILQPAGYLKLRDLGLDDCVREIDAQRVVGYTAHNNGKRVKLPYPLREYDSDVSGRCFHHGRFVQKLRHKAASLPNVQLVEGSATSLIEERGQIKGIRYTTTTTDDDDGRENIAAYSPLTILCDGHYSKFRKFLAKPDIDKPSYLAGLILENCQIPDDSAHIVLGNPSALLFYPLSSTEARCLIDFPGPKLPSVSNGDLIEFLKTVIAPQVPEELKDAFITSVGKGKIKVMQISCMPATPCLKQRGGAILLGDSLNMRHALTGGGMTVALTDVKILRDLLKHIDLKDISKVNECADNFYRIRKPTAFTINVMADALYKVIYASTGELRYDVLRASFNYVSLDYEFPRALIGLLSGLCSSPWKIVVHLFAIAMYTAYDMIMSPFPSPRQVYRAARFFRSAATLMVPMIWKEGLIQVFFTANNGDGQFNSSSVIGW